MKLNKLNFVLDVDGVLTSGKFFYSNKGKVLKEFGPHDAFSLKKIEKFCNITFISADKKGFKITKKRISDMGYTINLVPEEIRYEYIKQNYDLKKLIYMGDGDADALILKEALVGIAPANSRPVALKSADYVTILRGGDGAVADACDYLTEIILNL
jgi:3-deoxy-D-manno-octulosonate 8-phosphate phosphatase (KDO 8-P phosphatase)